MKSKARRSPFSLWLRPGRHNRGRGKLALLDRDGLLIEDTGYPHQLAQLQLLPCAVALCRHWQRQGYALVIISNQSGIARGYFSPQAYAQFTRELLRRFAAHRVYFRAVLACPHHPQGQHAAWRRKFCLQRKPRPGLAHQALNTLRCPPDRSCLAGDRPRDIAAGRSLKIEQRYWIPPERQNPYPRVRSWQQRKVAASILRRAQRQPKIVPR